MLGPARSNLRAKNWRNLFFFSVILILHSACDEGETVTGLAPTTPGPGPVDPGEAGGTPSVASIAINPPEFGLGLGEAAQLTVTVLDQNGAEVADPDLTFSSDDEAIATVDADGQIQAVALGAATITATSGGVSATTRVSVRQSAFRIVVDPALATIPVGRAVQLTARVVDENGAEIRDPGFRLGFGVHCRDVEIRPGEFQTTCPDAVTVRQSPRGAKAWVDGIARGKATVYAFSNDNDWHPDLSRAGWAVITVE